VTLFVGSVRKELRANSEHVDPTRPATTVPREDEAMTTAVARPTATSATSTDDEPASPGFG
jgi:hypothetical protein